MACEATGNIRKTGEWEDVPAHAHQDFLASTSPLPVVFFHTQWEKIKLSPVYLLIKCELTLLVSDEVVCILLWRGVDWAGG